MIVDEVRKNGSKGSAYGLEILIAGLDFEESAQIQENFSIGPLSKNYRHDEIAESIHKFYGENGFEYVGDLDSGEGATLYFRDIENKEQITEVFLEIYPVDFKNSEACQLFVTTQIHHDSDYLHIDKPDS